MKMKELLFFLSCVLGVSADVLHEDIHITGCSDSDGEDMYGLDGEEKWYADFKKHTGVYPQPPFVVNPFHYEEGIYDSAVANQQICKQNLKVDLQAYKNPPLQLDAPSAVMIYTRDEVEPGVQNSLICHVTGFYPAPVNVSWTKNGEKVTEGPSINIPFPNKDGTFKQTSRLDFIPQLGDIYSCAVEHPALTKPITKIYDVEASQSAPGVGPAVFCGVGLTVGLLGVAAGTFFLIKGNECS